jgi:hypothetical protein
MSTEDPTALTDVIVPEVFNPYYQEQSTLLNAFFASGVVAMVPDLSLSGKGGAIVQMPFWQSLGDRAQLLDDTVDLDIGNVETEQDNAVLHARALVYGGSDLAAALAGDDPMDAIAAGIAENWSGEFNYQLIATLKGAMGSLAAEDTAVNTLDISALSEDAAVIDGSSFIDAAQTMGDAKTKIVACAMHSATNACLAKAGLIATERDVDGNVMYETFMDKRVVTDDALSPMDGVYDTYLFGAGAFGWGEGSPKVPTETGRDPLKGGGREYLVTRRHYVLHPRGIKWDPGIGVPAKPTPSDAELAAAANWTRVWQPKNIRIVRLRHRIEAASS